MAYTHNERSTMRLQLQGWVMRVCIAGTLLLASGVGGGWKWRLPLK
jgi:hypothetical protein